MARPLRVQIKLPNGPLEPLLVDVERLLIGSGAHCEIRLPIDQARAEHVLLENVPSGLFARVLAYEPQPMLNGQPFQQAPLGPGAVLSIGGSQIIVDLAEPEVAKLDAPSKRSSPLSIIALLVIIPAGGYLLFTEEEAETTYSPSPRQVPELWTATSTQCAYTDRSQALAFARERMAIADAKRERRPFHIQDGVQAVPTYEAAAACFRGGGDQTSATLAEEAAKFLRRDITDDFRTRRVRLDHALAIDDYVSAQREVRVLLQFTEGKTGDYVTWLSDLDRKLKLKVGSKKS